VLVSEVLQKNRRGTLSIENVAFETFQERELTNLASGWAFSLMAREVFLWMPAHARRCRIHRAAFGQSRQIKTFPIVHDYFFGFR
jgi:hypothetical protein